MTPKLSSFFQQDNYTTWREKIKTSPAINKLVWDNVQNFLNLAVATDILTNQIAKTETLPKFMDIVREYGYSFTEQELAWVIINQEIIWEFLATAEKNPHFRASLLSAKTPQKFLEIARQNNHQFPLEAFTWILIDIKSSSSVRIFSATGEVYSTPVIGRIPTGEWISLAEEWGILAPFCHVKKPETGIFKSGDIDEEQYFLYQCFLPHGYFNQRLIN
jgi:Nif11 domain